MSFDIHKHPANSTRLNTPRRSPPTTRPPSSRRTSGGKSKGSPETTKPARFEAEFGAKGDDRTLGPDAKFSMGGGPLKVDYLKCGVQSPQKEHLSICKQTHTSRGGGSSSESSLQGRPVQLTCPGFSFEEIFGRSYENLSNDEREQVAGAARLVGLEVLEEKSSVISVVCSKESSSHQGPCRSCSKILGLSGFKNTLCKETPKRDTKEYFTSFKPPTGTVGADKDQKATNGKV